MSLLIFGITLLVVRSRTRAEHYSKDLEVANEELESFHNSVEQELGTARSIQHALLPKDLPKLEGWKIAYHYQPAREVGGDFYDFLRLDDGRVGLVIGDVSGKGIAAALVMANTQSVLPARSSPVSTASSTRRAAGSSTPTPATTRPIHSGTAKHRSSVRGVCRSA
jgi:hypothetical protein